ncbi:hypothetical protein MSG28_005362 [Choristoneura fumiferana]|uniref:Uncharacterized protein n=1 Tax=Choristoneura fumiferana TaxID=7141 RepID=A0ACC0JQX9_CHOFU|nr:hypothetical protein MSG28_005362 [Choristoneura fumiferana]
MTRYVRLLLKALIMENYEAIENKNTDANSNTRKVEAWIELENCFNTMCKGGRRTIAQLKGQWGTIKSIEKKEKKKKMEVGMGTSFPTDDGPLKLPDQDLDNANNIQKCHSQVFIEEIESDAEIDQLPASSDDLAVDLILCEQRCRTELHARQMENEAIKKENLLIEQSLLRKKIYYYDQKIKNRMAE